MDEVLIRTCEQGDLDAVYRMEQAWAKENITYGFVPSTSDERVGALGDYFLVAVRQGQVVGYIRGTVSISKDLAVLPDDLPYVEIEDLYVQQPFRSKGLGSRLMEQFERMARQNGIDRFRLYSSTKDLDLILAFYRSHGFKSWYVEMFK